jgi:hypothetical protein
MKLLFFAALFAVSVTTSAFAGTTFINTNDCKDLNCVVENFKNVTITSKADFTKATIIEADVKQEIFYNNEGDFIGASKNIAYDKLPVKAIKTISKYYQAPKYTVKSCIAFLNVDNDTKYYVSLDTKTSRTILEIDELGNTSVFSTSKI